MKQLVFGLISKNDLSVPDATSIPSLQAPRFQESSYDTAPTFEEHSYDITPKPDNTSFQEPAEPNYSGPIIISKGETTYDNAEVVDESLSLSDMEKEFIQKALKKHNGRRKDAAADLGISERTLYRKIQSYGIEG